MLDFNYYFDTADPTVRQNAITSVGTLVLTFNFILSPLECADVFKMPLGPLNRSKMFLFGPRNIDLMWNCPLRPHVLHSLSAFRSGTSAPFLGKNKYIFGRFGVPVGTRIVGF